MSLTIFFLFPLAAYAQLTTTTVTSFVTLGGTVTSYYECTSSLPFCQGFVFPTSATFTSPTSSASSGPTVAPAVGQPVTLSVTGSDGIPLAAELLDGGQLILVDQSTSTNAAVLFSDGDGFLRIYDTPSQVLFLGSWTRAGRYRRRQPTDSVSQIQSTDQGSLSTDDKAGNFSYGTGGGIELNVDGIDNVFYKSGTTGETQLYTADEGVDPGSEFDSVSVVPVIQDDLPIISYSSSSTAAPTTAASDSTSSTEVGTTSTISNSDQETTTSSVPTTDSEISSTSTTQDNNSETDSSSSTSSEESSATSTDSSSSTSFDSVCPTDTADPTVFATITGDDYVAVTDIISVGGAFYTCWCSSFLNLFAATRTVTRISPVIDLTSSLNKTTITSTETSTLVSQTGVITRTTTSYLSWPISQRHKHLRQTDFTTPDALTRFDASNITVGCNMMVSYPLQSTIEEISTVTSSGATVIVDIATATEPVTKTEFFMSTELHTATATPSSYSGVLGWRRPSGNLAYLEGTTPNSGAFDVLTTNGPAGRLELDQYGRLMYPVTDGQITTDYYAAAQPASDSIQSGYLRFALPATISTNGWTYVGFLPSGNTIFLDLAQNAGGFNNFGLCSYAGATPADNVERLIIMVNATTPTGATYCDFRSFLNFQ
ncbi:hypothetical protein TWF281_007597 [Arthrobotrys megalospora]